MWKFVCLIALLFVPIPAVFGQSDNGAITGFARDPSGAVIPKAKVTLRNEATGVRQQAGTDDSGYYIFNSVEPESSSDPAYCECYRTVLKLDAALTVGAATETVERRSLLHRR